MISYFRVKNKKGRVTPITVRQVIFRSDRGSNCAHLLYLTPSYLFPGFQFHGCAEVNNFNSCIFSLSADHILGLKILKKFYFFNSILTGFQFQFLLQSGFQFERLTPLQYHIIWYFFFYFTRNTDLEVEVYNVVFVKILNSSHYLPHEETAVWLSEVKIVSRHPLEELPAVQVLHHQDDFTRRLKRIYKP